MTLTEAAHALRTGLCSSEDLVRDALAVIERRDPLLNAFITVTAERALEQARETDRLRALGSPCGPLCGIPIALKDVFRVRGVRTTCGSRIFSDYVADFDCAVAEKLAAAGAILIGKTGLHEFAYGVTSNNPHFGTIRNPWNPQAIPGGSSGGSGAAVAAGMVFAAMGSDTGGSIRIPASYCGVVGLKPTSGRVSRFGVMPLDFSLDHMGPLTRTVRDSAWIMNAIAGHDERDDSSSPHPVEDYLPPPEPSLRGLRIGLPENFFFERIHPEVESAVRSAARHAELLGAEIVSLRVPDMAAVNVVGRVILMCEASALLEPYLDSVSGRRGDFGDDVLLLLDQGRLLPATDYVNAQRLRRQMQRQFAAVWNQVDCLFTPATPVTAPPIGAPTVRILDTVEDTRIASTRLARCINVLGLPAISLPCAFNASGMPVGLQIIARPFAEAQLLAIAAAIEQALAVGGRIAPEA